MPARAQLRDKSHRDLVWCRERDMSLKPADPGADRNSAESFQRSSKGWRTVTSAIGKGRHRRRSGHHDCRRTVIDSPLPLTPALPAVRPRRGSFPNPPQSRLATVITKGVDSPLRRRREIGRSSGDGQLGIETPKGVHIGIHCFRHGVTSELLESGTPIQSA